MKEYFDTIFKRRSMRKYDKTLTLSDGELLDIRNKLHELIPLISGIQVAFELVKREDTTAKFGEYCLLMYSEKKPGYLLNAGYLFEQIDLYLNDKEFGACWYGLAKPKKQSIGDMQYVIMLALGKGRPGDFRKGIIEFKRKQEQEIWSGEFDPDVLAAVRLAPSACNSQPWRVLCEKNTIRVFRNTKAKSIMPPKVKPFFNTIDMGIFLCFLEIALERKGYEFNKTISEQEGTGDELVKIAAYDILSRNEPTGSRQSPETAPLKADRL